MIDTRTLAIELNASRTTVLFYAKQLSLGKYLVTGLVFTKSEAGQIKRALAAPKNRGGRPNRSEGEKIGALAGPKSKGGRPRKNG